MESFSSSSSSSSSAPPATGRESWDDEHGFQDDAARAPSPAINADDDEYACGWDDDDVCAPSPATRGETLRDDDPYATGWDDDAVDEHDTQDDGVRAMSLDDDGYASTPWDDDVADDGGAQDEGVGLHDDDVVYPTGWGDDDDDAAAVDEHDTQDDGVRAPSLARREEALHDDDDDDGYAWYASTPWDDGVADDEDDAQDEGGVGLHDDDVVYPTGWDDDDDDGVPAPLPVRRERLYDGQNPEHDRIWKSDDKLASIYQPPIALMYKGTFHRAKVKAARKDKWLLVNLQSADEFSSHMLNRDTWSNEAVAQTIDSHFIFWQVDQATTEGSKVRTFYNLVSLPAILVIEPITGRRMCAWTGMIQPEDLVVGLLPYMDGTPSHRLTRNPTLDLPVYLPLPEEPQGSRELICRVGIRLPDGRRLQRSFRRADTIKLLWSFCCPRLGEGESRPFHFTLAIPGGASRSLDYQSNLTFEESGMSNSMVTLVYDANELGIREKA